LRGRGWGESGRRVGEAASGEPQRRELACPGIVAAEFIAFEVEAAAVDEEGLVEIAFE
jgi:hypothetical protein